MDSNMHIKGMAQRKERSLPGRLGCPTSAMAASGSKRAMHNARAVF